MSFISLRDDCPLCLTQFVPCAWPSLSPVLDPVCPLCLTQFSPCAWPSLSPVLDPVCPLCLTQFVPCASPSLSPVLDPVCPLCLTRFVPCAWPSLSPVLDPVWPEQCAETRPKSTSFHFETGAYTMKILHNIASDYIFKLYMQSDDPRPPPPDVSTLKLRYQYDEMCMSWCGISSNGYCIVYSILCTYESRHVYISPAGLLPQTAPGNLPPSFYNQTWSN